MAREMLVGAPRERLLAGMPVTERTIEAAGIPTAVLEGGSGEPLVLLHGPGEHAVKWVGVLPGLVSTHSVVAPDLPGHGATSVTGGPLTAEEMLDWLDALIGATCASPPALVGQIAGGAMAMHYAALHGDRVARLVLVDTLGLAPFQPAPEFAAALTEYLAAPDAGTFDRLWRRCAYDFERVRARMGERWESLEAYTLERMRAPGGREAVGALMEQFGFPPIPADVIARIAVPVTLIWGRHDLATPLAVAEAASARYGWPLHVVEDAADDPSMDQPERFLELLRRVLGGGEP
ncbi:MAG TPA: alpha/beta fold hydrolase [Gemmatimonadales bacterium]